MAQGWRLRDILAVPTAYRFFQEWVMNQRKARHIIASEYVKARPNERLLDIGCGPGDMIQYFKDVDYTGFDSNQNYIQFAQKKFGHKGKFFCAKVERDTVQKEEYFDTVLASQVIHHLSDKEARDLLSLAYSLLKPGGKLVSIDPCFVPKQSPIARFLISKDRGQFVRNLKTYSSLAREFFPTVKAEIRNDFLRVPYTFLTMECEKAA